MTRIAAELINIRIISNIWVENVRESIDYWCQELKVNSHLTFAPLGNVIQELIECRQQPHARGHLFVIFLKLDEWQPHQSMASGDALQQNVSQFCDAVVSAVKGPTHRECLVVVCPCSEALRGNTALAAAERDLCQQLISVPGVQLITSEDLNRLYPASDYHEYFDYYADQVAGISYSRLCFAMLGTAVMRRLYARWTPSKKVIVVDCDNTLWTGVCGESGVNISIGPVRRALQEFLIGQAEGGRLLYLCSKNNEQDVMAVLDQHREMVLRREHLSGWRVNWKPKVSNLVAVSGELGIGLDAFVFIDDDPVECAQIRESLPEVLTLEIPASENDVMGFLNNIWELDIGVATAEDRFRSLYYRQSAERATAAERAPSMRDFMAALELQIVVRPVERGDIRRVVQLTERTNQFNLNGLWRSEAELEMWMADGSHRCLVASAKDRFGDYGTVSVIIYELHGRWIKVNTLLISCRALGKGLEEYLMNTLAETARAEAVERLVFDYQRTLKNAPMQMFFERVQVSETGGRWGIGTQALLRWCPRPTHVKEVAAASSW
jgi:FkbH-like protein